MKLDRKWRVALVSGSRADWGHWVPLLSAMQRDSRFLPQLYVTGSHHSADLGGTIAEIKADGFSPHQELNLCLKLEGDGYLADSLARGVEKFNRAFIADRPDLLLVLGDRYEILAAVIPALLANIPIGHIYGGEVTQGAVDESIRHMVSKAASLHFVAAEPYRDRLVQMGENPDQVFTVGSLSLERLQNSHLPEGEAVLGGRAMLCLHPETATTRRGRCSNIEMCTEVLAAAESFPNLNWVVTAANQDQGGIEMNRVLEEWVANRSKQRAFVPSLGQRRFWSLLKVAPLLLGNSSSGIIEAPAMGVPVVNVGHRQSGRLFAPAILSAAAVRREIAEKIQLALTPQFRSLATQGVTPYQSCGSPSQAILGLLAKWLPTELLPKRFYDLAPAEGWLAQRKMPECPLEGGSFEL